MSFAHSLSCIETCVVMCRDYKTFYCLWWCYWFSWFNFLFFYPFGLFVVSFLLLSWCFRLLFISLCLTCGSLRCIIFFLHFLSLLGTSKSLRFSSLWYSIVNFFIPIRSLNMGLQVSLHVWCIIWRENFLDEMQSKKRVACVVL